MFETWTHKVEMGGKLKVQLALGRQIDIYLMVNGKGNSNQQLTNLLIYEMRSPEPEK